MQVTIDTNKLLAYCRNQDSCKGCDLEKVCKEFDMSMVELAWPLEHLGRLVKALEDKNKLLKP